MDAESLYRQLEQIIATMPSLNDGRARQSVETQRWLGRAAALVEQDRVTTDPVAFRRAVDGLDDPLLQLDQNHAATIQKILYRALARAELAAPVSARGAFIPIGASFDVFAVLAPILGEAKKGVLIVDPYMNATTVTDFVGLVPVGVTVNLLTDSKAAKLSMVLRPAIERWTSQYGTTRPLEARQSVSGALHDRLLLIDGDSAWSLSQSLKDFAKRAPGSISKLDPEVAAMKFPAYQAIWAAATPLP